MYYTLFRQQQRNLRSTFTSFRHAKKGMLDLSKMLRANLYLCHTMTKQCYTKYISIFLGNVIILAHELLIVGIVGTDISHSGRYSDL